MDHFWHPSGLPCSPSQSVLSVSVCCGCHPKFRISDHKLSGFKQHPVLPDGCEGEKSREFGFSASGLTRPKPRLPGRVRFQAHARCWQNSFPSCAFHGGSRPSHTLNLSDLLVPPARETVLSLRAFVIRSVLSESSLSRGQLISNFHYICKGLLAM